MHKKSMKRTLYTLFNTCLTFIKYMPLLDKKDKTEQHSITQKAY